VVKKWIDSERVTVDGIPRKASFQVSPDQKITVDPLPPEPSRVIPEEFPLEILYEDDDLLIINKSAGQVVHPGAGNWSGTLANALAFHFSSLPNSETLRPGIIHRLDKGTSGVLVVAKNELSHEAISKQFQRRETEKEYLALVYGTIQEDSGEIDVAIGRDVKHRTKISTRTNNPKEAITCFNVIRRYDRLSYCRIFPKTGRTHQIRVHFLHIGHPVVGDDLYAPNRYRGILEGKIESKIRRMDRLFLHATRLAFFHPTRKEKVKFSASLPSELEDILTTLGE
jgi:23S rRNA pseudouridine1911/1915/1917 synthase